MIYLDAAATTPVRPEILDMVWPLITTDFGNPSSHHGIGETAARALDFARTTAASVLRVRKGDIVFTSGGTEANNLAIKGLALARPRGRHLVRSAVEHSSVREACDYLVRHHGFSLDVAPVDENGQVDPEAVRALVRPDTTLVTVMAVNNEVGTIQPVAAVAQAAHDAGALMHTDAVQAAGWLDIAGLAADVDALTISGHKLGGMKGAGLAMIRGRLDVEPTAHGGGQERGRRSGTENVAGAVSTATALRLSAAPAAAPEAGARAASTAPGAPAVAPAVASVALVASASVAGAGASGGGATAEGYGRYLIDAVLAGLNTPGRTRAVLTGHPTDRVPGIVSFAFPGTNGETVLLELERRGVIASSGSACAAGSSEPSPVLLAMGLDPDLAQTAVRLSFGRGIKEAELTTAARAVVASVKAIAG